MSSRKFGYGRVSSKDQNETRQLKAFKDFGINDRDIYVDKKSGKDFDREQYKLLKTSYVKMTYWLYNPLIASEEIMK